MSANIKNEIISAESEQGLAADVHSWQKFTKALIDPSRFQRISSIWEKAPHGQEVDRSIALNYQLLGNGIFRTLKTAGITAQMVEDKTQVVAIGGPCLTTEGDKGYLTGKSEDVVHYLDTTLPRLDQVIDGVGTTNLDNVLVVFEDSLFASKLTRNSNYSPQEISMIQQALERVAKKTLPLIGNWLSLSRGKPVMVIPFLTSHVAEGLTRGVHELSRELNSPTFPSMERSIVDVTYTGVIQAVAADAGFINHGQTLLMVEPFHHFTVSESDSSHMRENGVQRSLILPPFYQDQPFGQPGFNEKLTVAGFMPMFTDGKKLVKDLPPQQAITVHNVQAKLAELKDFSMGVVDKKPFPLNLNPVARLTHSLLFWDPGSRNLCYQLVNLAEDYRLARAEGKSQESYIKGAYEILQVLVGNIEQVLLKIGYMS